MKVSEIMQTDPACCTPDAHLNEVAQMMHEHDCGEIPVVSRAGSRELVGVVTDRDIVIRAVAQDKRPSQTRVAEVMTPTVVTVHEDADLQEVCEKMEDHQIRRVPVVDSQGHIRGIVSQADIALKAGRDATARVVQDISQPAH